MAVYRSDQAQLTFATEAAQGSDPEMIEGTLVSSGATGIAISSRTQITLLAEDLDNSETGIDVDDGTLFAVGDIIRIDIELMLVGSISTNTLTVTRGYLHSTAVVHSDNAPIYPANGFAAGTRAISLNRLTYTYVVGDFIRIGTLDGTAENTVNEHEVRRIESMSAAGDTATNTFTLDRPLAFFHLDIEEIKEINAIGGHATRNDKNKYITFIPGVYETVDTPDPEMSFEGKRFLGTQSKRNWSVAYPGQQTLTGSVSGIVLLNGWPLRYPIGKVTTIPQAVTGSATLDGAVKKGDVFITLSGSHEVVAGDIIAIYDAANTTNTTKTTEVRKAEAIPTANVIKLNYPLHFDHITGSNVKENNSSTYYDHEIVETTDLDTVSWHVHVKESSETAAKNFDRRYVGGMIGSSTISAEEGGMVTMSWDSVNFLNMLHNQQNQLTVGASALYTGASITANMPRYGLMQAIDTDDVGMVNQTTASLNTGIGYPNTQPYYFSQGEVKFFDQTFARIRSFSISISNGEEPRYYIGKQGTRARGPYEIKEGPRDYSMSCSLVLPDATVNANATAANASRDGALELFKQLLLEGDYGGSTAATARAGFTASLRFDRGTNDYIIIDIPGSTTAGTPTAGSNQINSQGIFINTAPHGLTTDNPFQVDADMIFRSMKINIRDTEPYYP